MTTTPGHSDNPKSAGGGGALSAELQLRIEHLEAQVKQLTAENWRLRDAIEVVRTATSVALTQTGAWSPPSPTATVSVTPAAARQLAPQIRRSA